MPLPYHVTANIDRDAARELLVRLSTEDGYRAELESDPQSVLASAGIEVTAESLPQTVTLPSKEKIADLLPVVDDLIGPTASPFGFVILVVVFAAMPMVAGTDGTG